VKILDFWKNDSPKNEITPKCIKIAQIYENMLFRLFELMSLGATQAFFSLVCDLKIYIFAAKFNVPTNVERNSKENALELANETITLTKTEIDVLPPDDVNKILSLLRFRLSRLCGTINKFHNFVPEIQKYIRDHSSLNDQIRQVLGGFLTELDPPNFIKEGEVGRRLVLLRNERNTLKFNNLLM
jgi:hypothetical protein